MRLTFRVSALAAAALLSTVPAAVAGDHTNLESGLPVVIEDAYVTPFNSIEAQGYLRYDHLSRGQGDGSQLSIVPRIEWGAARNLQLTLETPYRAGDARDTKQGDVTFSGLYNLNNEGVHLPAISVGAGASTTYGYQNGGAEVSAEFVATKSLGSVGESYIPRRLSFNAIYYRNVDRREDDRAGRWRVGVAYAQPVTNDLVLVADVYREEQRTRREAENVAEIGGRYQLDPQTVVSLSVGGGFANQSPDGRFVVGFQHVLSRPWFFGR